MIEKFKVLAKKVQSFENRYFNFRIINPDCPYKNFMEGGTCLLQLDGDIHKCKNYISFDKKTSTVTCKGVKF